MSYDRWKLSSPYDKDTVSNCCGEYYTKEYDLDLEFDYYVCVSCQDKCEIIDEEEYNINRHKSYLEESKNQKKK